VNRIRVRLWTDRPPRADESERGLLYTAALLVRYPVSVRKVRQLEPNRRMAAAARPPVGSKTVRSQASHK
jgi:hypothetical protein